MWKTVTVLRQSRIMEGAQLGDFDGGSTVKRDTGSSSLQDGGKDVFVHISAVERAGLPGLNEGQSIEFEVISSRGKASAENLKVQR